MQRHTFFKGIPCIADENHLCCRRQRHHPEQRHTLFREISCVAKGKTPFSGTFMQRHTFFKGIPCIADENHLCSRRQRHHSEQRHTLFREISCVAKGKTPFSGTFMQRHTFFKGTPCIADENHLCCRQNHSQTRHSEQRHTIFRKISCVVKGETLFS